MRTRPWLLAAVIAAAAPVLAPAGPEGDASPPLQPAAAPGAAEPDRVALEPEGAMDSSSPPPGLPEDQALWKQGIETTQAIHVERARASRVQVVLRNLRYFQRLLLLVERGGEEGKRAEALTRRLDAAYAVQYSTLNARWPVEPTRGCSYPAVEFGSTMDFHSNETDLARLAKHRAILRGCIEMAQSAITPMRDATDKLEAAMRAAADALQAAGLGDPSAGLASGSSSPASGKR
jgi:hypothetical protein